KVRNLPFLRYTARGLPRFCAVLALLSLHAPLASCQSRPAKATAPAGPKPAKSSSMLSAVQTDKFNLSASPGTADGYPVTIDKGRFFTSAGGGFPIPSGHFIEQGWGGTAIGWAVGDPMQPAPDSLEIRWYSYAEDAFWQGKFLLPQERIYTLLKQGLWMADRQQQLTYTGLSVSVLPTGGVVVWLNGQGNKVLIGRYQAQRIDYDYALHRPRVDRAAVLATRRAQMSPEVQQEIKSGTLSAKKWDDYLRHYRWQLEFSQPVTLAKYGIGYLSAEETNRATSPDMAAFAQQVLTPVEKAVPQGAMLYLTGTYGRKRLLKIKSFDEAETQAAFRTLHTQFPAEPLTLHVELNPDLTTAVLSLRAGGKSLPLTKSKTQLFDY
ncbi:MAG: DUF2931 family protein, partial [Hymenobacter sp.]